MKNIQSIGLIFVLFLMGAHSCAKTDSKLYTPPDASAKYIKNTPCKSDDDCIATKADCCGCRQGGTQKAVAKASLEQELASQKSRCQGTMCIQAISTDESCAQSAVCRNGQCVLE